MPDYTLVLKTFASYRKMAPDDVALFETFCAMTDHQRELLAETLGPPVKAKVSKAKPKHFQKCDTCGISKRAAHHRDVNHRDYHEFDSGGATEQKKSKRGLEIAKKIQGTARGTETVLCTYELNGKVCKGLEDDAIHDKSMGYGGYHPFVSSSSAPPALGQSSTNGDEVSSKIDSDAATNVSSATGG